MYYAPYFCVIQSVMLVSVSGAQSLATSGCQSSLQEPSCDDNVTIKVGGAWEEDSMDKFHTLKKLKIKIIYA